MQYLYIMIPCFLSFLLLYELALFMFLVCFLLYELVLRKRPSDNTKLFISPTPLQCLYLYLHLCLPLCLWPRLHFVCLCLHAISECCACFCVVVFMKIIEVIHYLSLWITKTVFTLHYIITQLDAQEMFVTICPVKTICCIFMFITCVTQQFKTSVISSFATSLCLCVPVCLCVRFLSSSSFFILKI